MGPRFAQGPCGFLGLCKCWLTNGQTQRPLEPEVISPESGGDENRSTRAAGSVLEIMELHR